LPIQGRSEIDFMVTRCLTLRDATGKAYEELARCYRVRWCEWRVEAVFVEVLFLPMTTVRSSFGHLKIRRPDARES
jgi:hypothetical protein